MYDVYWNDDKPELVGERNARKEREKREASDKAASERAPSVRSDDAKNTNKRHSFVSMPGSGHSEKSFGFLSINGRKRASTNTGGSMEVKFNANGSKRAASDESSIIEDNTELNPSLGGGENGVNAGIHGAQDEQTAGDQSWISLRESSVSHWATPSLAASSTLASSSRNSQNTSDNRDSGDSRSMVDSKLIKSEHHLQQLDASSFVSQDKQLTVSLRPANDNGDNSVTSEVRITSDSKKAPMPALKPLMLGSTERYEDVDNSMLLSYHEATFPEGTVFGQPDEEHDSSSISAGPSSQSVGGNQTESQRSSVSLDSVTLPTPVALHALPPPPGPPPRGPPPAPPKGKNKQRASASITQSAMPTPSPQAQRRQVRGPVQPPPLQTPIVRDSVWKITSNLTTVQRDIIMMATASPEVLLANVKADPPALKNAKMYEELEAIKKRWMFSCLYQNDVYANWLHQNNFDPQNVEESASVTPSILALYERSSSASFLAGLNPTISLTQIWTVPTQRELFPNLHPVTAPTLQAKLGFSNLKHESFTSVTCLRMGSMLAKYDVPIVLAEIYKLLKPGGALHVTLMDPCPEEQVCGPLMRKWMRDNLIVELEKHARTTSPSRDVPAWMKAAELRGRGSHYTQYHVPVVPAGYDRIQDDKQWEPAMGEARCRVMAMLWYEIWGNLIHDCKWWWDDEDILKECAEYGTYFAYFFVTGVKEAKPAAKKAKKAKKN
ncbi:hypothetical protein PFICI_08050 [Pestalotiopsis fici W106-1]|uniref:Uncharacterized protein n=1 Tax=Pestalotiopsis fici (strain W106-1 / CGMCC3.15140) TaxID=1229662 RepID=W3X5R2_PESFW|nr:uncharacterized protein PFICI_08050 [Pestalotiopsis fici W106-1]ETS80521.1 hypothetical protein PFICI_08050 [Pestalotiopsis fici W106-1]